MLIVCQPHEQKLNQASTDLRQHEASLSKIRVPSDLLNPGQECSCVCRMYSFNRVLVGTDGSSPFTAAFPDQWA